MATQPANAQDDRHKIIVTWDEFFAYCSVLRQKIEARQEPYTAIYGIPVGGWFPAREISEDGYELTLKPDTPAILIVDDITDSGKTLRPYVDASFDTAVLFWKDGSTVRPTYFAEHVPRDTWVVFPWESKREIGDSVIRILEYIGENPAREGLADTPRRVIKSWEELYCGYRQDPKEVLAGAHFGDHKSYDQIITLNDIDFYSMCEHHMLPFYGTISIGYLPNERVAGVSKLARMVEIFSRRLQIQERMTQEIADAIEEVLQPKGVGVVCKAQHFCMIARGVKKRDSLMVTSSVRGEFRDAKMKEEFFRLLDL